MTQGELTNRQQRFTLKITEHMTAIAFDWSPSRGQRPRALWLLAVSGTFLLLMLVMFGCVYVSIPSGWSPRLGHEADVTPLFPQFWSVPEFRRDPAHFTGRAQLVVVGLWTAYLVALLSIFQMRSSDRPRGFRLVMIVAIAAHGILLLLPPVISGDLFQYALFGRMVAHYGLNPYITAASRVSSDPLWPYASWNFLTTHFGPGFTWLSAAVTTLSQGDVFWTAIGFKALMSAMTLAACWFVRDISMRLGGSDGVNAFAIYALNPVVLIETGAMGHNEAVVVFYCVAGLALALRGRPWVGFSLLLLSADVKFVSASVALLFAVHFVFQADGARARARRAARLILLSAAIALLLWAPFWRGDEVFATIREILGRGRGLAPGLPEQGVSKALLASFASMIIGCAVMAARVSLGTILTLSSSIGLAFVLFIYPWSFAWYTIPPLAFAVIAPRTKPNAVLLVVAIAFGFVFTAPYTHLYVLK